MTASHNYLAIDLDTESRRTIVGILTNSRLPLTEIHRYPNLPHKNSDGLHGNAKELWNEIKIGIKTSASNFPFTSLGLDTCEETVRVNMESIELRYRLVREKLEDVTEKPFHPTHIISDGTKNRMRHHFSADCTGRTVITGPIKATTISNALVQVIINGHLASLAEALNVTHTAFTTNTYQPGQRNDWDITDETFQKVRN